MTRLGAPAMTAAHARRWAAAAVPWWVPRVVLVAGWVAAFIVALDATSSPCTPDKPSVCGPNPVSAWAVVALLATPVLLWWMPVAGCASGVLFAVYALGFDDSRATGIAFGMNGFACLLVAAWLVAARRRQATVAAEVAAKLVVPVAPGVRAAASAAWGVRMLFVGALVVVGLAGMLWYRHEVAANSHHVAAAARLDARVVKVDQNDVSITVELPEGRGSAVINVVDAAIYRIGSGVPVLVDHTGKEPWVRLVAEPDDKTFWLFGGLAALTLAGLLAARDVAARAAVRRLLTAPAPAVEMVANLYEPGRAVLYAAKADRAPLAVARVREVPLSGVGQDHGTSEPEEDVDEEWDDVAEFGRDWRGEVDPEPFDDDGSASAQAWLREPVTVLGEFREGGWVVVVAESSLLLPKSPLRVPRSPLLIPWKREDAGASDAYSLPGRPISAEAALPLPELPFVLRPSRRDRLLGALMMLALPAGPFIAVLGFRWGMLCVLLGGFFAFDGWDRLSRTIRVEREGLVVTSVFRVHKVPWARVHGVRCDGDKLMVAWEPDVKMTMGSFDYDVISDHPGANGEPSVAARAKRVGATMMRLRELALAAGDPGIITSRVRLGSGAFVGAVCAIIALAMWWVSAQP